LHVGTIIRLNRENYDKTIFTKAKFKHFDLFFKDGTIPPTSIIEEFIKIVQEEDKGVAVHCKAGLGRTGTLIGCYMLRNFDITGR